MPVALLQLTDQLLGVALDLGQVVVGQLPPLLADLAPPDQAAGRNVRQSPRATGASTSVGRFPVRFRCAAS